MKPVCMYVLFTVALTSTAVAGPAEIGFFELGKRVEKSFHGGNPKAMRSDCYISEQQLYRLVAAANLPDAQKKRSVQAAMTKVPSEAGLANFIAKVKSLLEMRKIPVAECKLAHATGKVTTRNGMTFAESIDFTFMKGMKGFVLHFDMAQHADGKWLISDGPHGWITVFGGKVPMEKIELK